MTNHELQKSLGAKIRQIRLGCSLSQEALAGKAGIHRTYMGLVERGESNITLNSYAKIARALDMTLSRLLDGVEGQSEILSESE